MPIPTRVVLLLKIFIEGSIENYQIELASYDDRLPIELPDSTYGDITRLPIVEYDGGYYYERKSSETISKEELLTTYWHQKSPYGDFCPNDTGGCGPVAAAQIMAYHKHPAQFGISLYNWDVMTVSSTLSSEDAGADYVAQLILDIGDDAGADYIIEENPEYNRTPTNIVDMKDTFRNFGYSCGHPSSYNIDRIQENINAESPIYIRGENSDGGHAWVIDGYQHTTYRTTYYYTYEPYARYDTFVSSTRTYFHCNLGWGPDYDDNLSEDGYYNAYSLLHNNNLQVIYDITPNK